MGKNQIDISINKRYTNIIEDFKKLIIEREPHYKGFFEVYVTTAIVEYMSSLKYGKGKNKSLYSENIHKMFYERNVRSLFKLKDKVSKEIIELEIKKHNSKKDYKLWQKFNSRKEIYKIFEYELDKILNN